MKVYIGILMRFKLINTDIRWKEISQVIRWVVSGFRNY